MKKIRVFVNRSEHIPAAEIFLPASYEAITDACEQAGYHPDNVPFLGYQLVPAGFATKDPAPNGYNLWELNHLATLLDKMDDLEEFAFGGVVQLQERTDTLTIPALVNIAMNVEANSADGTNIGCYPAQNAYELGEFYVVNDLIPEIAGLDGDVHQWVLDHTDFKLVGKEICQQENGAFVDGAYVTANANLPQLYDGKFEIPPEKPYIFTVFHNYVPLAIHFPRLF